MLYVELYVFELYVFEPKFGAVSQFNKMTKNKTGILTEIFVLAEYA